MKTNPHARDALRRAAQEGRAANNHAQLADNTRANDAERNAERWVAEELPDLVRDAARRDVGEIYLGWSERGSEARAAACEAAGLRIRRARDVTSGYVFLYARVPDPSLDPGHDRPEAGDERRSNDVTPNEARAIEADYPEISIELGRGSQGDVVRGERPLSGGGLARVRVEFYGRRASLREMSAVAEHVAWICQDLRRISPRKDGR